MTWFDASDPSFQVAHPYGAWLYDARGRMLEGVIACNPDTGEVLTAACTPVQAFWFWVLKCRWPRCREAWIRCLFLTFGDSIATRHGFWPAPLTLISKQSATQQLLATVEAQEVAP